MGRLIILCKARYPTSLTSRVSEPLEIVEEMRSHFGSALYLLLSCYTLDSLNPVGNYGFRRASNERSIIVAECMESVVGREAG